MVVHGPSHFGCFLAGGWSSLSSGSFMVFGLWYRCTLLLCFHITLNSAGLGFNLTLGSHFACFYSFRQAWCLYPSLRLLSLAAFISFTFTLFVSGFLRMLYSCRGFASFTRLYLAFYSFGRLGLHFTFDSIRVLSCWLRAFIQVVANSCRRSWQVSDLVWLYWPTLKRHPAFLLWD